MSTTPISLFNTLTRQVEAFETIDADSVRIYCCGPTVYNYQHIGNLRTYIFEDLLTRTLRYAGLKVNHVMNITDVGHLVSDADSGEDKMLVAMRREGKSSEQIAQFYTDIFFDHCALLNIRRPTTVCKATDHIKEMIELIKRLESNGFAYLAGGNVYFDVAKFNEYGRLAQLNLDSLQAGARIEVDSKKKNAFDFALWFTKSKFEGQELQWDSPWGTGYPGWHIECSAMAMRYLGEQFDIHCGGIDHIPVHHTNEIAQSQCATGHIPARVWMHGAFLVEKDKEETKKMSKSAGSFLVLDDILTRKLDPLSYRLMCLSASYRSELAWSWQGVESAHQTLQKLRAAVVALQEQDSDPPQTPSAKGAEYAERFRQAIFDDLAMPRAMATVHAMLSDSSVSPAERLALAIDWDEVLGLGVASWKPDRTAVPAEVKDLADKRVAARREKNFALSDQLRDQIAALGYTVLDTKDGYTLKREQ